jgi:hypothetical protein
VAFQAKRLRVALPCGEQTVIELGARFAADEKIVEPVCIDWLSTAVGSCADEFTWQLLIKPADLTLDAEHLPIVRQQLEAQLRDIEKAEEALRERGGER